MATVPITCGNCELRVAAIVVEAQGQAVFLLCPSCKDGSVRTGTGAIYPPVSVGSAVEGTPDDVAGAWREARTAYAVAAYTASEIMCRKILMHLAVDLAGSAAGQSFATYIDDLDNAGYFAPGLRTVVDRVRARGNIANHDLPASTESEALTTLKITNHMLRTAYELPNI